MYTSGSNNGWLPDVCEKTNLSAGLDAPCGKVLAEQMAEKADKIVLTEAMADFDKRMDAIQELVED